MKLRTDRAIEYFRGLTVLQISQLSLLLELSPLLDCDPGQRRDTVLFYTIPFSISPAQVAKPIQRR